MFKIHLGLLIATLIPLTSAAAGDQIPDGGQKQELPISAPLVSPPLSREACAPGSQKPKLENTPEQLLKWTWEMVEPNSKSIRDEVRKREHGWRHFYFNGQNYYYVPL